MDGKWKRAAQLIARRREYLFIKTWWQSLIFWPWVVCQVSQSKNWLRLMLNTWIWKLNCTNMSSVKDQAVSNMPLFSIRRNQSGIPQSQASIGSLYVPGTHRCRRDQWPKRLWLEVHDESALIRFDMVIYRREIRSRLNGALQVMERYEEGESWQREGSQYLLYSVLLHSLTVKAHQISLTSLLEFWTMVFDR